MPPDGEKNRGSGRAGAQKGILERGYSMNIHMYMNCIPKQVKTSVEKLHKSNFVYCKQVSLQHISYHSTEAQSRINVQDDG